MPSVHSERVVFPDEIRPATIHFEEGRIVELSGRSAHLDFGDLVILPGLVDSHVHINEPGRTDWEGFETATRAAAAGGSTTLVDMPLNSVPPTVTVDALRAKLDAARGKLSVDVAFWGGLIPGSATELEALVAAGVRGFKVFLVDSGVSEFPRVELSALSDIAPRLGALGVPLLVHAEDESLLVETKGDPRSYRSYLESRPVESEVAAVRAVAELAAHAKVHILHVSSADAAGVIASGPSSLTGETCPHYLTFAAADIAEGATAFKCAPPIRDSGQREDLWKSLATGGLNMVVSDHSPAPADLKEVESGDFSRAWGGIASLQIRLPVVWTGAVDRGFSLVQLARWLALEPARLAGLDGAKGSLGLGMDADFVVFDPDGSWEVDAAKLEHRHRVTPYDGMKLRGKVVATFIRGEQIFEEGRIKPGRGKMIVHDD